MKNKKKKKKKIQKKTRKFKKKSKKIKNQKEENPKRSKKKRKNLFSVVLDKICVFCLYPIPDSQQYVKRGSCRRPILSGLLCLFSFWASSPFVTSFEFGPRTLSVFYFIKSLSHLVLVILFRICLASNCFCRVKYDFVLCRFVFNCVSYLIMTHV